MFLMFEKMYNVTTLKIFKTTYFKAPVLLSSPPETALRKSIFDLCMYVLLLPGTVLLLYVSTSEKRSHLVGMEFRPEAA